MTQHPTTISVDKLSLLRRYPPEVMSSILDTATIAITTQGGWYYLPAHNAGATARLIMALPDENGERSAERADLRFYAKGKKPNSPGYVRIEWNPAKAGPAATSYILHELAAFLPENSSEFLANVFVTRIDLAVDVPGISCRHLAAQRTSHHRNAAVFVGANGDVNSIRIGARGSSAKIGTFLRVYDKPLPGYAQQAGVRAEIEIRRAGELAAVDEMKNPFSGFSIYEFPPSVDHAWFACFVSAVREKGAKRALELLPKDARAEFQAILDQHRAAWWAPGSLWEKAKESTAGIFGEAAVLSSHPSAKAA